MSVPSHQPTPVQRPLWMLIGPGLGAMLAAYQFGLLFVLHDTVQRDFGFSLAAIVMVILAHLVGAVAAFVPGYLFGHRAPSIVAAPAIVLMLGGAVMTMLSGGPVFLVAAALLTGLGGGAVLGAVTGLAIRQRGPVRLALGLAVGVGLLGGSVLGWLIMTMLSWRLPYILAVPLGLAALLATAAGGVATLMRPQVTDRRA